MSDPLKDRFGHELEVGRFIVYAGLLGRSAILQFGMVRSLRPNGQYGHSKLGIYNEHGGKASLMYPSRVIAVNDSMVPEGASKARLLALRSCIPADLPGT